MAVPTSPGVYDYVIIGGGFYGCRIAVELARLHHKVLLVENQPELMLRASFTNQARVHGGYHYPRSLLTALRSRVNLPIFTEEYGDCIDSSFEKYYAIARQFSKVTAVQFKLFCDRIQAPISPAPAHITKLFNDDLIEDVFLVREYAFNANGIREKVKQQLAEAGVEIELETQAVTVSARGNGLIVALSRGNRSWEVPARRVLNCTYSQINALNARSGLPAIPLKHELTEMALVEPPDALRGIGITVMCGPFFSFMPFPALGLHSLSHVRYTPHTEWSESSDATGQAPRRYETPASAYPKMIGDARRYLPLISDSQYKRSLWEVKTVLPQSENDDSRPILYRADHGLPGYTCVMGGKLDNIYDVLKELAV